MPISRRKFGDHAFGVFKYEAAKYLNSPTEISPGENSDEIAYPHYLQQLLATTPKQSLVQYRHTGGQSQGNEEFTLTTPVHCRTSVARDEKAVQFCATDHQHVSQPFPEISFHFSAVWDKHPEQLRLPGTAFIGMIPLM